MYMRLGAMMGGEGGGGRGGLPVAYQNILRKFQVIDQFIFVLCSVIQHFIKGYRPCWLFIFLTTSMIKLFGECNGIFIEGVFYLLYPLVQFC